MSEGSKSEVSDIKQQNSYRYWVTENNKSRELPEEHRPKKIEIVKPQQVQPAAIGPSKWNTLGSWQQRSISMKQLNQSVESSIREWLNLNQCQLQLKQASLQGEFKQIFSNNKRKVLYEISGKIAFEGQDLMLKLQEITCSGDRQFKVKGKSKQESVKLQSIASLLVEQLIQVFNRYKE